MEVMQLLAYVSWNKFQKIGRKLTLFLRYQAQHFDENGKTW